MSKCQDKATVPFRLWITRQRTGGSCCEGTSSVCEPVLKRPESVLNHVRRHSPSTFCGAIKRISTLDCSQCIFHVFHISILCLLNAPRSRRAQGSHGLKGREKGTVWRPSSVANLSTGTANVNAISGTSFYQHHSHRINHSHVVQMNIFLCLFIWQK